MLKLAEAIPVDKHFSTGFYAELLGVSKSWVVREFQDREGVLKLSEQSKCGRRTRVELRIPFSLFMQVYREKCR